MNQLHTLYLCHGGGPFPVLATADDPAHGGVIKSFQKIRKEIISRRQALKAIILVTAHWEEDKVTISSGQRHPLLYDYYGFPKEAYSIKHDAPGHPEIAGKIEQALTSAGISCQLDAKRGWDHGVFIPMKLLDPEAKLPVVQVSLVKGLDPNAHFEIGQALLRGVLLGQPDILLIGSGSSYHSFSNHSNIPKISREFDAGMTAACKEQEEEKRRAAIANWQSWPHARKCHEREEHLAPVNIYSILVNIIQSSSNDAILPFSCLFVRELPVAMGHAR